MSKRYIVAVSNMTDEDEKNFIAFLREHKILWWRWIDGFWLLVDRSEKNMRASIRDHLHALPSSTRGLVIEIKPDDSWVGFGPRTADRDMFKWIKSTWDE
jgi:hypothetical protein